MQKCKNSYFPAAELWPKSMQVTSQYDGFTEWACSIDIDCCHLENILSVWSKVLNYGATCCFWFVSLHFFVSTTGCIIPHNIASNGPILLDTRHLSPPERYFTGLHKHAFQWLWSSWGDWACNGCWLHWLLLVWLCITNWRIYYKLWKYSSLNIGDYKAKECILIY